MRYLWLFGISVLFGIFAFAPIDFTPGDRLSNGTLSIPQGEEGTLSIPQGDNGTLSIPQGGS